MTNVLPVTIISIAAVSPDPTNTAVSSIDVTFSRAMNTGALASGTVTLTDDGNPVAVSGLSLAPVSGNTYAIKGLAGLTTAPGLYALTVNAAGFRDHQYNAVGTGTMSTSWLMDPTPPTSTVSPLPKTGTSLVFPVTVTGAVPAFPVGSPAVDIASFNFYVSVNGGAWTLWKKNLAPSSPTANSATVNYTGASNTAYAFYATATDTVGNAQAYKPTVEATTDLPNLTTPATQVASSSTYNGDGTFTINVTGTDAKGNGLAYFQVYVAIGAGTPVPIGPVIPAGVANAQGTYGATTTYVMPAAEYGIASNAYKFSSVGIDAAGHEEPMHAMYDAMIPNVSYSEPAAAKLALGSITVEDGAAERSFVRYIDLNFDDATTGVLQSIVDSVNGGSGELTLTQYNLGDSAAIGPVSLKNMLHVIDDAIEIDFGTGGIGGAAGSATADGYYALTFAPTTGQGNGSTHHFDRILGDVTGDGVVDQNDLNAVAAARGQSLGQIATAIGQPASGLTALSMDVNGDGAVNTIDTSVATTAKNRGNKLGQGLPLV